VLSLRFGKSLLGTVKSYLPDSGLKFLAGNRKFYEKDGHSMTIFLWAEDEWNIFTTAPMERWIK
jgi:hypothetical protein